MTRDIERLEKLYLPRSLSGKRVLDIGCGRGFFSRAAWKRGAKCVTALDHDPSALAEARREDCQTTYIRADWWQIPATAKYDFIFCLDCLQCEPNPKQFLNYLKSHLEKQGVLVAECIALPDTERLYWTREAHGERIPTIRLLTEQLFQEFVVRNWNWGTPIYRDDARFPYFVIHGSHRLPTVILMGGRGNIGKSGLARLLGFSRQVCHFSVDEWLQSVKKNYDISHKEGDLWGRIRECNLERLNLFVNSLSKELQRDLAKLLLSALPLEMDCIILEGYELTEEVQHILEKELKSLGVRVWNIALMTQHGNQQEIRPEYLRKIFGRDE